MAPRNVSSNVVALKPSHPPVERRRGERRQPADPRRLADQARLTDLARAQAALAASNAKLRASLARSGYHVVPPTAASYVEPVTFTQFAPNAAGLHVRKPRPAK